MKKIMFIFAFAIFTPFFVYAMEQISDHELDTLTGAAGVNIKFIGELTIKVASSNIAWGDLDGKDGTDANKCFLMLQSTGSDKTIINLSTTDPEFVIDVATTDDNALMIGGKTAVAANTTFIKIDLPDDLVTEILPCDYTEFLLTEDPSTGTGGSFATVQTENLKLLIEEFPTNIYISAHD